MATTEDKIEVLSILFGEIVAEEDRSSNLEEVYEDSRRTGLLVNQQARTKTLRKQKKVIASMLKDMMDEKDYISMLTRHGIKVRKKSEKRTGPEKAPES